MYGVQVKVRNERTGEMEWRYMTPSGTEDFYKFKTEEEAEDAARYYGEYLSSNPTDSAEVRVVERSGTLAEEGVHDRMKE